MAQNVTLYNLLISCPGDIKNEVDLIDSAVNEFNELFAEPLGITIKTRYWNKSSYAQSGGKPQKLLNKQFADNCDAAVAIFWTRFGTPTDEYGSGTEEEIENMLKSEKQVFMYFSEKSIPPSKLENTEYQRVLAFKEKYKDCGIYFTYSSDEEFKKMFFAHLSMYFLYNKKDEETSIDRILKLQLIGIDEDGNLSDEFSIYPFVLNKDKKIDNYIDEIRTLYKEISEINVGKRTAVSGALFNGVTRPVDIDDEERIFITKFAEQFDIKLPDGFFDLGNLRRTLSSISIYGDNLEGENKEKTKYRKIKALHEMIYKAAEWASIENAFSEMYCIRLAVQNCGKVIDEDVEITFQIPKNELLTLAKFPKFTNDEMNYLLNECNMYKLFGIESTADYVEYSESERNNIADYIPSHYVLPGHVQNYSDDFIKELKDIFSYSIYLKDDNYIVKLKVDYIKHNTTVAFPTILFVRNQIKEIHYKITSENNPEVVEEIIKAKG